MDNNKNDDLLKVENYEQNEYVVASSIVEPPVEKAAKAEKKVTLFNVLVSAVSLNKKKGDATYTALRPIKTLKFVIVIAKARSSCSSVSAPSGKYSRRSTRVPNTLVFQVLEAGIY